MGPNFKPLFKQYNNNNNNTNNNNTNNNNTNNNNNNTTNNNKFPKNSILSTFRVFSLSRSDVLLT